jgi:5-formyltetrahydrofolate cyclo-ligase
MGFYDRLLPQLSSEALRIGISPKTLVVESLPREAFDVPMTHLVTETGLSAVPYSL